MVHKCSDIEFWRINIWLIRNCTEHLEPNNMYVIYVYCYTPTIFYSWIIRYSHFIQFLSFVNVFGMYACDITNPNHTLYFVGYLVGRVCGVTMATEALEIALHHLQRNKRLLLLLHPPPCLLRPCCLCRPLRMWVMREEGRRRFGCLCSDTWAEPSCWPAWPSVKPGTSGTSHTFNSANKMHIQYVFKCLIWSFPHLVDKKLSSDTACE